MQVSIESARTEVRDAESRLESKQNLLESKMSIAALTDTDIGRLEANIAAFDAERKLARERAPTIAYDGDEVCAQMCAHCCVHVTTLQCHAGARPVHMHTHITLNHVLTTGARGQILSPCWLHKSSIQSPLHTARELGLL